MKISSIFRLLFIPIVVSLFGFFLISPAKASAFTLQGTVTDQLSNPIGDTTITVVDSNTQAIVGTTTTTPNTDPNPGTYSLSVPQGTYNITAIPPASSGLQGSTFSSQVINSDMTVNFILVPIPPLVTLSGRIVDRTGAGIANMAVGIDGPDYGNTTDSNGYYSVQATPGSHIFELDTLGSRPNLPSSFTLQAQINVNQDTTFDLQLPSYLISFHVQDVSQNPVANATVSMKTGGLFNLQTSLGSLTFKQTYGTNVSDSTDNSGNVSFYVFPWTDNESITVTVPDGTFLPLSSTLNVTGDVTQVYILQLSNQPPVVNPITITSSPTAVNTSITASANFADVNTSDTHTASWNWGDGNTTTGTITENNGSGSVSDAHTYTTAGIYSVTLTVTDNHGASGITQYQYVAVYDPSAGFLTGSGKYTSQAGWDMLDTGATGEVKLGIQAKYTGGNTAPTGQTKISFKLGNLDFTSTSYQWLVVNGAKAVLMGNGTINGSGNYTFLISAIDGSQTGGQDLIRIQVRDSSQTIVYDTQPGQPSTADPTTSITNGSIKAH